MSWTPGQSDDNAIVKFEGRPNDFTDPVEQTRWQSFKRFISPFSRSGGKWAKHGAELADAYAGARVGKEQSIASEHAAKAAEHAAKADLQRTQKAILCNEELQRIFSEEGSEGLKKLQLASLLAENPQIQKQLDIVEGIIDRLCLTRGTSIRMVDEQHATVQAVDDPPQIETVQHPNVDDPAGSSSSEAESK